MTWSGDGNNVAASLVHAAVQFDFELRIASPRGYEIDPAVVTWAKANGGNVHLTEDPAEAVSGADCVFADTWVSLGDEDRDARLQALGPYQVNQALMDQAKDDALFLHCLPAHRGEEVTDEVIDGPQSVVWDEAENRLHAQKAILRWTLGK
jgi:ornithine carbamoyltransferase